MVLVFDTLFALSLSTTSCIGALRTSDPLVGPPLYRFVEVLVGPSHVKTTQARVPDAHQSLETRGCTRIQPGFLPIQPSPQYRLPDLPVGSLIPLRPFAIIHESDSIFEL